MLPFDDQEMIYHANGRGEVRVRGAGGYVARAALVAWIAGTRCRIEYTSGARRTIRKDSIVEVIPRVEAIG